MFKNLAWVTWVAVTFSNIWVGRYGSWVTWVVGHKGRGSIFVTHFHLCWKHWGVRSPNQRSAVLTVLWTEVDSNFTKQPSQYISVSRYSRLVNHNDCSPEHPSGLLACTHSLPPCRSGRPTKGRGKSGNIVVTTTRAVNRPKLWLRPVSGRLWLVALKVTIRL